MVFIKTKHCTLGLNKHKMVKNKKKGKNKKILKIKYSGNLLKNESTRFANHLFLMKE
jgi:hypothetical protein